LVEWLKLETIGRMVAYKQHLKDIVTLLWLFVKRMSAFVYEIVFAVRGTAEIT